MYKHTAKSSARSPRLWMFEVSARLNQIRLNYLKPGMLMVEVDGIETDFLDALSQPFSTIVSREGDKNIYRSPCAIVNQISLQIAEIWPRIFRDQENDMDNQIGNYLYFDGMIVEKSFGQRKFTVLIAAAKAGPVIDPKGNGVVILDNDYGHVVLDGHHAVDSGLKGPVQEQFDAFKAIFQMEWDDFSHFIATHPNYRGSSPDINAAAEPVQQSRLERWIRDGKVDGPSGPDIRSQAMREPDCSYTFPASSRIEMIVELANHRSYFPNGREEGGFALSWDIKLAPGIDPKAAEGYEFDGAFDERWDALIEEDGNAIEEDAANSVLHAYRQGEFSPYGLEAVKGRFFTSGRSGGHLVLDDWTGPKSGSHAGCAMGFASRDDYIDWLKSLKDDELVQFYALIRTVDEDVANRTMAMNHEYAFIRQQHEERWKSEAGLTI